MYRWRIYYDDGSTFDNLDGDPWEAPGRGVICIVVLDPSPTMYNTGTIIWREESWYWYHRKWEMWIASDLTGLLDQLVEDKSNSVCAVRQGRWVHPVFYRKILDIAQNDADFPNRTGGARLETLKGV